MGMGMGMMNNLHHVVHHSIETMRNKHHKLRESAGIFYLLKKRTALGWLLPLAVIHTHMTHQRLGI